MKGHYAHRQAEAGFVGGQPGLAESAKFGIVAATQHPQLDYQRVNYSRAPWASRSAGPGHQLRGLPRRPHALGQAAHRQPHGQRGRANPAWMRSATPSCSRRRACRF
ncbi:MAG: hypothetical protein WKG07_15145 [Hymenobacter sp.]